MDAVAQAYTLYIVSNKLITDHAKDILLQHDVIMYVHKVQVFINHENLLAISELLFLSYDMQLLQNPKVTIYKFPPKNPIEYFLPPITEHQDCFFSFYTSSNKDFKEDFKFNADFECYCDDISSIMGDGGAQGRLCSHQRTIQS